MTDCCSWEQLVHHTFAGRRMGHRCRSFFHHCKPVCWSMAFQRNRTLGSYLYLCSWSLQLLLWTSPSRPDNVSHCHLSSGHCRLVSPRHRKCCHCPLQSCHMQPDYSRQHHLHTSTGCFSYHQVSADCRLVCCRCLPSCLHLWMVLLHSSCRCCTWYYVACFFEVDLDLLARLLLLLVWF